MNSGLRKMLLSAIYFACSIPMYYFYTGGVKFLGFDFQYCYIAAAVFVIIAFCYFLIAPDPYRMSKVVRYSCIMAMPYVVTMIFSLFVWVMNLTGVRVMVRGFFWPSYQILAVMMGAAAVYCFGKSGVYYQLTALIIAYCIFFIQVMAQSGVGVFFADFMNLLATGGDETGVFAIIEKIAYAHGMGMFLIYLILTVKENKKNLVFMLPALICFLSGYKRSALVGAAAAFAIAIMGARLKERGKKNFALGVELFMVAFGFLYIYLIAHNLFNILEEYFDLNTMGRSEIYSLIREYYDYSIAFFGRGLGYVSYYISRGLINVGNEFRGDIHNDFLRQYIELGMMGYFVWLWLFFKTRVKMFMYGVDVKCGIFTLSCFGYCFGCYLTENMYYRFNAGLAVAVVVISYALQREEEREKNEGLIKEK